MAGKPAIASLLKRNQTGPQINAEGGCRRCLVGSESLAYRDIIDHAA